MGCLENWLRIPGKSTIKTFKMKDSWKLAITSRKKRELLKLGNLTEQDLCEIERLGKIEAELWQKLNQGKVRAFLERHGLAHLLPEEGSQ